MGSCVYQANLRSAGDGRRDAHPATGAFCFISRLTSCRRRQFARQFSGQEKLRERDPAANVEFLLARAFRTFMALSRPMDCIRPGTQRSSVASSAMRFYILDEQVMYLRGSSSVFTLLGYRPYGYGR